MMRGELAEEREAVTRPELAGFGEGPCRERLTPGQGDVPERGTSRLNPRALTDQSQPQLLPFLCSFSGQMDIWGPGSGHRCSVSDVSGQLDQNRCPGGTDLDQESAVSSPRGQ